MASKSSNIQQTPPPSHGDHSGGGKGVTGSAVSNASNSRRNTVNELFAALEQRDIAILRQVADGIKTFDRFVVTQFFNSSCPLCILTHQMGGLCTPIQYVNSGFHYVALDG